MKKLGCFCYLVNHSGSNSVDTCIKSLTLLNENYLDKFTTSVILLHEEGLTDQMQERLVNSSNAPLTFVLIPFETPAHIKKTIRGWGVGYLNMCRFFANDIFKQPILDNFEYYCRLDTDSFILSPVLSDIFEDAKNNNIKYGYINDSIRDIPKYTVGLWELAQKFIKEHEEIPVYSKLYSDIEENRLYYTNFELCHIPWFRSDIWKSFFEVIDNDGGIYRHRWGDHVIRYIGVRLFMPPEQIKRITSVHYSHQGLEDNKPKWRNIDNEIFTQQ